jgi:flagellar motor switch protein FliM
MSDQDDIDEIMAADEPGEGSDDALAAEWAAMSDGDGAGDDDAEIPGQPTRVLNQDEIDSLLGFDAAAGDEGETSGIRAILNSALVSYERLPMLEVVFDRLVRLLSTSLRNFTSDNVEVSLDSITSIRFGDYLNSIPLPAILSVFRAEEWDNYGLVTVDSSLIYSIVDVLLGGRRGTAAMRIEGRPYTTIERTLVGRMVNVVLADMAAAFEPLSPVAFVFDRLETNPRFATIGRAANAAILVKLRVDMEDRGGRIEILLPYATLEPIRELLLQMFMGEKFGRDTIWENHLATELWYTDVAIEAVLDEQVMSLKRVMEFEVGHTLMLNATPDGNITLRCGEVSLMRGRMGRIGSTIAIQVEESLRKLGSSG